ncbi:MAG: divalent-cation tolerance protein CutA [Magnetococcales bacterium]|nr:divalent-cation tolerance protein CutA [Magnetococcales bacterium]
MTDALVVLTTAPDESRAEQLAETLVQEGLAACVHILPQGRSVYRWEGAIHKDAEWSLLIKTTRDLYPRLESRLQTLHPYEVPEILALEVTRGHGAYLDWLTANVS